MDFKYTTQDFIKLSWSDIENDIEKMTHSIKQFMVEKNLRIKYIVPILRGGGIPGILFAYKMEMVDTLPVQIKRDNQKGTSVEKISFDGYKIEPLKEDECLLFVEGNTATGKTANIVAQMAKQKFGNNTKILYATLTQDYAHLYSCSDILFKTCGRYTNETKKLDADTCSKLGIDYRKVYLFPWEDVNEEVGEINT